MRGTTWGRLRGDKHSPTVISSQTQPTVPADKLAPTQQHTSRTTGWAHTDSIFGDIFFFFLLWKETMNILFTYFLYLWKLFFYFAPQVEIIWDSVSLLHNNGVMYLFFNCTSSYYSFTIFPTVNVLWCLMLNFFPLWQREQDALSVFWWNNWLNTNDHITISLRAPAEKHSHRK